MGTIVDAVATAFRRYVTDGVPASGAHKPDKGEIFSVGSVIETAITNVGLAGLAEVAYPTKAELDADLAHADGAIGLVHSDPTAANNDLYVKAGASGTGAWSLTTIIHDIVGAAASEFADDAAASAAAAEAAAAALLTTSRAGSPNEPIDGTAMGDLTLLEEGTQVETNLFTHVRFYAKALTPARFLVGTRSGSTETVRRYVEVVPTVLGINDMELPTPLLSVAGEQIGAYAPNVYGSGAGYNATFSDTASFDGSLEFYLYQKESAVEDVVSAQDAISQAAASGAPDWVEDPTQYEADFTRGLFWNPDEGRAEPIGDQLFLQTEIGWSLDSKGRLFKFPANRPRLTDKGLRVEAFNITNLLANPFAPATQTVSLAAGTYTASCGIGGSVTLSGGPADIVLPGMPVVFTLAATTSVTFTVSGTPEWMQCQSGEFATMPVSGTRAGDIVTPHGRLAAVLSGAAYTAVVEVENIMPNVNVSTAAPILGAAGADVILNRRLASNSAGMFVSGGASINHTFTGTFEQIVRAVVTGDASIAAISANGAAATSSAKPLQPSRWIGRDGSTSPGGGPQSGMFIRKIAFKAAKVTTAQAAILSAPAERIRKETIYHPSSIDPVSYPALDATICYDELRPNAPLLVIMHGWSENSASFNDQTYHRLARRGFFVVAPNMRARPAFTGRDASARELVDILDAVDVVRARYPEFAHTRDAYMFGYSGGGGNVLAMAMKAPDAFNLFASHFGVSDYGYSATYGWYFTDTGFQSDISNAVGGVPGSSATIDAAYRSRYAIEGVPTNLKGGHLLLFHDVDDALVDVEHSRQLAAAMTAAGNSRFTSYESSSANWNRWEHGLPNGTGKIVRAENFLLPRIHRQVYRPWSFPLTGSARVHGFLRTKQFEIVLDDRKSSVATVDFDVSARSYTVTPVTTHAPIQVTITQGSLSVTQTISSATVLTPVA
jgi:hypothetical protein